jgi:chemosensory pili system protein ChpA (sensor histidine kinase/response regulator)
MNERDSVIMFAEELLALVGLLRRHLDTLRHPDDGATHSTALDEFRRLSTAVADLSAGYHADDCAQLARAILRVASLPPTPLGDISVLTPPVANALKYLFDRASEIHRFLRVTFPTDAQLATLPGILTALQLAAGATPPYVSVHTHADLSSSSGSGHTVIRPHRDSRPLTDAIAPLDLDLPMPALLKVDRPLPNAPPADYTTREALPVVPANAEAEPKDDAIPVDAEGRVEHDQGTSDARGRETLSGDELAVIRAFQSSALKPPATPVATPPPPPETLTPTLADQVMPDFDFDEVPAEMAAFFRKEAAEDLVGLREALLQVEQSPGDRGVVLAMAHIAHKLKGSAAQFGFNTLASVTMDLESALKALLRVDGDTQQRTLPDLAAFLALAQSALDGAEGSAEAPDVMERAASLRDRVLSISASDTGEQAAGSILPLSGPAALAGSDPAWVSASAALTGESPLKLDVRELEQLTAQVHSLAFSRAALAVATDEVQDGLREIHEAVARLRELHVRLLDSEQRTTQGPAAPQSAAVSDAAGEQKGGGSYLARLLGGRRQREDELARTLALERFDDFDHALRGLGEAIADGASAATQVATSVERMIEASNAQWTAAEAVQRDVMRLRLVPLADLLAHLRFELKRLQQATGKRATLTVRGEETPIDRHVLDALREPMTQLLRNAVVHGIEDPEERARTGKPMEGAIWLTAAHEGGSVVIEFGDDGRGVNPSGVVASALVAGLIPAGEQRTLTDDEALQLMFEPGVTTLAETRMVGGGGIGLDQVRAQIQRLRGTIVARSREGEGSVFTLRVPVSLAMLRALFATAGGETYAVPFDAVERTVLLDAASALAGAVPDDEGRRYAQVPFASPTIPLPEGADEEAGELLPIFALGELLGIAHQPGDRAFALVVGNGTRRAAVVVDDIVDDRESIVQALPRHLRRRILRGATVTSRGDIALVVDLTQLIESGPIQARTTVESSGPGDTAPAADLAPCVLVVDDSESIRRSVALPLVRAGIEVETAGDGIEALEHMLVRRPQVVLLDVEMPRLDGFELLAAMREHDQLKAVPVVLLTSRAGDRHIERARELGAVAYLIKPCPQDQLLRTVQSLLPARVGTL